MATPTWPQPTGKQAGVPRLKMVSWRLRPADKAALKAIALQQSKKAGRTISMADIALTLSKEDAPEYAAVRSQLKKLAEQYQQKMLHQRQPVSADQSDSPRQ